MTTRRSLLAFIAAAPLARPAKAAAAVSSTADARKRLSALVDEFGLPIPLLALPAPADRATDDSRE
jgi:hypothetical protein